MDNKNYYTPKEIAQLMCEVGVVKTTTKVLKLFLLGILAGAFVALAGQGSNVAIYSIETTGIAKFLAGLIFPTALIMVVLGGAELFTGNTLIIISVLEKKSKFLNMLKNWGVVYIGNFIGSVLISILVTSTPQFSYGGYALGVFTMKTAIGKISFTFIQALISGILCNWLVCLAVWLSYASKDVVGKIFSIFFPIWLFVTSGFEHSIANMYYISAGIISKSNENILAKALELGIAQESIDKLNWGSMIINNLIPVTIGNIIGGTLFVGTVYWLIYMKKESDLTINLQGKGIQK